VAQRDVPELGRSGGVLHLLALVQGHHAGLCPVPG